MYPLSVIPTNPISSSVSDEEWLKEVKSSSNIKIDIIVHYFLFSQFPPLVINIWETMNNKKDEMSELNEKEEVD